MPGPGHYTIDRTISGPAPVIGSEPRRLQPGDPQPSAAGPGPGAYDPHDTAAAVHRSAPAYSFGAARPEPAPLGPAPNAYTTSGRSKGPAYSFGARPIDVVVPTPGPAEYEPNARAPVPAARITGKPRAESVASGPGPGKYYGDLPAQQEGISFGIRPPDKSDPKPGQLQVP